MSHAPEKPTVLSVEASPEQQAHSARCALAAGSALRARVEDWAGDFTPEGWITSAGKFLPCDREMLHGTVAMLALGGEDAETRAERLGWLRLSDYGDRICKPINQAQRNTLWDYCQALGLDYAETEAAIKFL